VLERWVLERWVLERWVLERWVLERWVLERWVLERWLLERWLLERWVLERWVLERWLLERWLLEVGPAVVRRRVLAAELGPLSLSLTRGCWSRLPSYRWGSSRTRGWWPAGWLPCRRQYQCCFLRVALSPALALEWHGPVARQPALWPGWRECRGHSVAGQCRSAAHRRCRVAGHG